MTVLDGAFLAAKEDSEKIEAYYREFLNTDLIVPLIAPVDATDGKVVNETQAPVLVVELEGQRYIPVFDSLERFQAWVPQPLHYIQLKAKALVAGLDGSSLIFLNTNTPYAKVFMKEEILGLQSLLQGAGNVTYPAGDTLWVRDANRPDPKIVACLKENLAKNPDVLQAHLVEIAEQQDTAPHLLLMVECENAESYQALFSELDAALRGVMAPNQAMDLKAFAGDEIDAVIAENAKPLYLRD